MNHQFYLVNPGTDVEGLVCSKYGSGYFVEHSLTENQAKCWYNIMFNEPTRWTHVCLSCAGKFS